MERKPFTMSEAQLEKLLDAPKPTPAMYLSGGQPIGGPPQANANRAWQDLGDEMGFVWDTVRPVPYGGQTTFTAQPKPERKAA